LKNILHEERESVRIGISSCLLGQNVRFDGGHKRDSFLTDVFGPCAQWIPVCPEMEIGLGVPRETLRLVDVGGEARLVAPGSRLDHTDKMRLWAEKRIEQLAAQNLCGYVFKRGSPSCGMERVKIYRENGSLERQGSGVFASALMRRLSLIPVEEEGRLQDPRLRENFISRVFCYKRWIDLMRSGITRSSIMTFHARHKFVLMAHSQAGARSLGNVAARGDNYFELFSHVMHQTPTRRNHTNVLQHVVGYFSKSLTSGDRAEVTMLIDRYRRSLVPLIAPITLIRHYVRKYSVPYLSDQVYLDPHPEELMLLNQI
jgi:uncharacterized protein YbgA (DUF1722 family)/uncharacterized protein YbbK (DUF523 family)